MIRFPAGLEPLDDLTPAAWVDEALKDWPRGREFLVRDLVPPIFEAYARILHRPLLLGDGREPSGTWLERAAALGRSFAAEIRLTELEGDGDGWSPNEGSLSVAEASTLSSFLTAYTSDPATCWFGVWSGWGSAQYLRPRGSFADWRARRKGARQARRERKMSAELATFDLLGGGRSNLLIGGAVQDAGRFTFSPHFQSATLWWPDDRAWFVHTEVDASSTYVGGSRALVDRLVGEQVLESFEVDVDSPAAL